MPQHVEPIFRVVSLGGDNQGVTLPFADSPSVPPRIGIFWKGNVVRPDFTVVVRPVERLEYFPRSLNELESPAVGIHGPGIAQWIAAAHWVISENRENSSRSA